MMQRLDVVLFDEYRTDARALALYRIVFASLVLILTLPDYLWIGDVPNAFLSPPFAPFLLFQTAAPPREAFLIANVALVTSAVFLLVGLYTRTASVLLSLLWLWGNSWSFAFGKIDHVILMTIAPLFLAAAGWGNAFSLDARRAGPGTRAPAAWPLALYALWIGLGMGTAAWAKLAGGWLDPSTQAVRGHLARNYHLVGRENPIAEWALSVEPAWIWEMLDVGTIGLEGLFVVAFVRRRLFRLTCALACFFHLGIAVLMEIAYWYNLVAYGAFLSWGWLLSWRGGRVAEGLTGLFGRIRAWQVGLVALGLATLYLGWGNPVARLVTLLGGDPRFHAPFLLCLIAIVPASWQIGDAWTWLRAPRAKAL